eukprot:8449870-Pyramimonas_sp.AAC.1
MDNVPWFNKASLQRRSTALNYEERVRTFTLPDQTKQKRCPWNNGGRCNIAKQARQPHTCESMQLSQSSVRKAVSC